MEQSIEGRRVHNRGDVCNAARDGVVEGVFTNRWGTHALIRWDDPESMGWERDGTAAPYSEPTSTISVAQIGAPGSRERFTFCAVEG